ncbi:hypothetical protein ACJ72_08381 [Emergomyces africanus]|uniref:Uncharacterized protein n=1 Tax=Emergomyces africanus TaxID=1955775 RepID=A0A1B7NKH7_9EURO|nr:hypothetical protein ACJ72_08381 [Emergomyces africanus]
MGRVVVVVTLADLSQTPVVSPGAHVFEPVSAEEVESASAGALLKSRVGSTVMGSKGWGWAAAPIGLIV